MSLFRKEWMITFKGLTYWVVVAVMGLFLFTQLGGEMTMVKEPQPNQKDYGMMKTKDKQQIQKQTYDGLLSEYLAGEYVTYPFGFQKTVRLSTKKQQIVKEILEKASGEKIAELEALKMSFWEKQSEQQPGESSLAFDFPLKESAKYAQFQQNMQKAAKLIGRGSAYEKDFYLAHAEEPKTYEQAQKDYKAIVEKDQVSGAYARMVCDYLGIVLALVPIFIGTTVMLRDKRSHSQAVLYTKQVSTGKLVVTRYVSTVLLILAAVLIMSLMPAVQTLFIAEKLDVSGNLGLFYGYIIGWLTPTILAVVGLSFFLTECLNGIFAMMLQVGIWLFTLFTSSSNLTGSVGWRLIPRFNSVGNREIFDSIFSQLVVNRLVWSFVGILCCLLTVILLDYKRKGGEWFGKRN